MCVYVCVVGGHVYVCIWMSRLKCLYMYTYVCTYLYMCTCVYVCEYVHVCVVWTYVYIWVYICVYECVHLSVSVCVRTFQAEETARVKNHAVFGEFCSLFPSTLGPYAYFLELGWKCTDHITFLRAYSYLTFCAHSPLYCYTLFLITTSKAV